MLALDVDWLGPTYEAGLRGAVPEWPPHPARAFCALVSVAEPGTADDDALRWLEAQPPPTVFSPPASGSMPEAFVPTNATGGGKKDTSQQYVGRTSVSRLWPRSLPSAPTVRFEWPDADPSSGVADGLDLLAKRVPYLGRAAGHAVLRFNSGRVAEGLVPAFPVASGDLLLRIPYSGYLDALRRAFDADQRAWMVSRETPYAFASRFEQEAGKPTVDGPYTDLVTLGFRGGVAIEGRHTLAVASSFKAAALQRLGTPRPDDPWDPFADDALALIHGHHDRTGRQAAFLALPFVGHARAHGDILGVGVCLSADLDPAIRRGLLHLLGLDRDDGPRLERLTVSGVGTIPLEEADDRRTLDPKVWSDEKASWSSVTPIVLDRWPKRSYPIEAVLADGCEMAGYPRPVNITVRSGSAIKGTAWSGRANIRRRPGEPTRPFTHATLTFDCSVRGPVVIGQLRHLGLGLCLPRGGRNG